MRPAAPREIRPPATLGVIGGGQLGLYFARAAHALGYRVAVLDPDPASPAMAAADEGVVAAYDDPAALARFASACAAVTVEFERVPAASVAGLEDRCVSVPRAESIAALQDRIREKRFLRAIGLPVVPFTPVLSPSDLRFAGGYPGILKTAEQDYDAQRQAAVADVREAVAAWHALGGEPCLLERRMALDAELSLVLARGADGAEAVYPLSWNRHEDGRLAVSVVPAPVPAALTGAATRAARHIARCLDYVGVLAVEFFLQGGELYVNEVAPRPHGTGFYTLEACAASQFEQQVRVLCGLPLGDATLACPVATVSVTAEAWRAGEPDWARVVGGGHLHLYGKSPARPRRKMGHVAFVGGDVDAVLARAEACRERLLARRRAHAA